jgi:hypothetical protein
MNTFQATAQVIGVLVIVGSAASCAARAQPYVTPAPNESFLHANPNALHDLLGSLLSGTYPGQADDMRNLDASCKDLGEAKQRQWGMYNQCQENHQQLVEKGLAR